MKGRGSTKTRPRGKTKRRAPAPADEPQTGLLLAAGLMLVVITVLVYLPASKCGFIWDDDQYVQKNETLRSVDGLGRIWFEIGATPQYYPLVYTSFWLEYHAWGLRAGGYHMVNILLHAAGAVLLWRMLTILQVPGAWLAAATFAVHPVHVESVAWITERKNVLSGAFYLASALAFLRFALPPTSTARSPGNGQNRGRSRKLYAASLALYLCALASKTVTCTLPAVLLLVLWWKRRVRQGVVQRSSLPSGEVQRSSLQYPLPSVRADVLALAPFFAIGIAFGLLTIWVEREIVGTVGEAWNLSFPQRCLVAGRALCFYTGKLFWPERLTFIYPRWAIDAEAWEQYLYPLAAISVMVALWLVRRRIGKGPLVAALCFAGTLLPALGFVDVYPMRYSFVADHFQYLASAALITLVVAVCCRAAGRLAGRGRTASRIAAVLVLVIFSVLSWRQEAAYKDLESLWRDTLDKNPNAWMAHTNLGIELQLRGQYDQAAQYHRRALELKPDQAKAHINLGNALKSLGEVEEAISHYHQALSVKSDNSDTAEAHFGLGIAFEVQGKTDQVIASYRRAIEVKPGFAKAHFNLAVALQSRRELDEAMSHYRQALKIEPNNARAHNNLGGALGQQGRLDEAIKHFRTAVQLDPSAIDIRNNLNRALQFKSRRNGGP